MEAQDQQPDARLVDYHGRVRWIHDQLTDEVSQTNLSLHLGNTVRTSEDSMAVVWFRNNDCSCKLGESSTLRIGPPQGDSSPVMRLFQGALYFFSRERTREAQIWTPHATGAPRGTEFVITVEPNRTVLAMLDGTATLTNAWGATNLQSGELGVATDGSAPVRMRLEAKNLVQWWLYYPGALDVDELNFSASEKEAWASSLKAYRLGDLSAALFAVPGYPAPAAPQTDSVRLYLAGLYLAAGQVDKTEFLLGRLSRDTSLAAALRLVIAAVQFKVEQAPGVPTSASEWLGLSYYYQARNERQHLEKALWAATNAVARSPNFAFGWERVAELEFSFGRIGNALTALNRSLELAPRNAQAVALKGFLMSAQNRIAEALDLFEQAIALDGALGNAWLGRGLCRIRRGQNQAGLEDLKVAAELEPNRSLLRSYLGKAFSQVGDYPRAEHELLLARQLDSKDPTSWLYSALLHQQQNRINEAIRDLEKSEDLNNNRSVYRSGLLLDQDEAVRGANLANIYQDAGMDDVSVREATRAVNSDYANYSAHLFLANSYNQLRDPNQINLRYETPWLSEFLLANLLAPVGAGTLSQTVSQQDYSKLFQRDGFGLASSTEYLSRGDWLQAGAQYGTFGNFGYAVDTLYRSDNGWRPNNDQQQLTLSATFKAQLTPSDTVLLQSVYYDASAGDLAQYYNQDQAHTGLRTKETQEPLLLAGYHHEWSPGMHTLLLVGRFQDTLTLTDPQQEVLLLGRDDNGQVNLISAPSLPTAPLSYQSDLEIYSAELQQLWQQGNNTLVLGARYQTGTFDTQIGLGASTTNFLGNTTSINTNFPVVTAPFAQRFDTTMERVTGYAYDQWRVVEPFLLSAGLSYDYLQYPVNFRTPPIAAGETSQEHLSPKAGFTWTPLPATAVRFAYTRSLGGVSFDQSVRLEPIQVAGFDQAFRSLIPESVSGSLAGARFETFGLAWDQKLATSTYVGVDAELLNSDVSRTLGEVDVYFPPTPVPSGTRQELRYQEKDLLVTINQLIGDCSSLGARYRLSRAQLESNFPEIPDSVSSSARLTQDATLHQLTLFGLFYHPCGFFARAEGAWYSQSNGGYQPPLPGDDFWQVNLFAGYRFFRRRAQVEFGVLNLTDRDYRLNPLNLYLELPRARTFMASLQFTF